MLKSRLGDCFGSLFADPPLRDSDCTINWNEGTSDKNTGPRDI